MLLVLLIRLQLLELLLRHFLQISSLLDPLLQRLKGLRHFLRSCLRLVLERVVKLPSRHRELRFAVKKHIFLVLLIEDVQDVVHGTLLGR